MMSFFIKNFFSETINQKSILQDIFYFYFSNKERGPNSNENTSRFKREKKIKDIHDSDMIYNGRQSFWIKQSVA